jgi:DNA-binding response OmpR family regulator
MGGYVMNILVCDDEKDIVEALDIYLSSEGYSVFKAYNGEEALSVMDKEDIQLVLLDVMMPVMDGITAMAKIREKSNVPIIMLTAKSQDTDKVLGLNVGADDYVTKPFNPVELIARVKSQLRRYMTLGSRNGSVKDGNVIVRAGIELDDDAKTVTVDGEPVNLTPTEFQILKLFMENPGKVFSPKDIYRRVWDDAPVGAEGTVAVHIRHLREKVEINPSEPRYLKVVWGQGYKLEE